MKIDGIDLIAGEIVVADIEDGVTLPTTVLRTGRLFYLTAIDGANEPGLYVYSGSQWDEAGGGNSSVIDYKESVRAATTASIALSGTQTVDGVSLIAGDRVLVKEQSTASQNGLYEVAAGAWARTSDATDDADVTAGMFCFVEEGTVHADTGWVLQGPDPLTVGSSDLNFVKFSTSGSGVTFPLLASDGSKTAPAYAFANDTDMGLYRNGTDELAISVGGSQQMFFDGTHVGIPYDAKYSFTATESSISSNVGMSYNSSTSRLELSAGPTSGIIMDSFGSMETRALTVNGDLTMGAANDIKMGVNGFVELDDGAFNALPLRFAQSSSSVWYYGSGIHQRVSGNDILSAYPSYVRSWVEMRAPDFKSTSSGSATDVTYGWESDSNTGMYLVGGDTLGFAAGGAQRLQIDSSGLACNSLPITDVADPTNPQDVATKAYVDANTGTSFPLLGTDGTQLAPTYSFTNSNTTGMFSDSVDTLSFSANNTTVATVTSTGLVLNVGSMATSDALVPTDMVLKSGDTTETSVNTSGSDLNVVSGGGYRVSGSPSLGVGGYVNIFAGDQLSPSGGRGGNTIIRGGQSVALDATVNTTNNITGSIIIESFAPPSSAQTTYAIRSGAVSMRSGRGGENSATGAGGSSGNLNINTGTGGTSSGTSGNGGNAGIVVFRTGGGGKCTATTGDGGAGGALFLQTGAGGACTSTTGDGGNAGTLTMQAGNGGTSTNGTGGDGGSVVLQAGDGGSGSASPGTAGSITITAGSDNSGNGNDGSVIIESNSTIQHKTISGATYCEFSQTAIKFNGLTTTGNAANAYIDSSDGQLYRSTSSARYKDNITSLTNIEADSILNLRPVTYTPKDDASETHLGFIAEEVAEVNDKLAEFHDYGEGLVPEAVRYERVTVLLTAKVQQQEAVIKAQQDAIYALEARLSALEAQ